MSDGDTPPATRLEVFDSPLALVFATRVAFDAYPGITLRGLAGYALAERERAEGLDGALTRFFKPPDPTPPAFMLDCEPGAGEGHVLNARAVFFGAGREVFADLAEALAAYGARGFGAGRALYTLRTEPPRPRPDPPWAADWRGSGAASWRVHFVSPTPLYRGGGSLADASFVPLGLAESAARRLERLASVYGCTAGGLVERARDDAEGAVVLRHALRKVELRRTSSFGGHEVAAGGLEGWVELAGPPAMERWLMAGAWLGVGKKVSSGNGRLRVEPMA